jgi:hypothetical protein
MREIPILMNAQMVTLGRLERNASRHEKNDACHSMPALDKRAGPYASISHDGKVFRHEYRRYSV